MNDRIDWVSVYSLMKEMHTSILVILILNYFLSFWFDTANVAAAMSGILFFAVYVPYWIVNSNYDDMSKSEKLASCLLFNCAMGLGAKVIGIYEGTGK